MIPENSESNESIGDYQFYSIGNNRTRHDSSIDEYIIIPEDHSLIKIPQMLKIYVGFNPPKQGIRRPCNNIYASYLGNNTYHWKRYYLDSQECHRKSIYSYMISV